MARLASISDLQHLQGLPERAQGVGAAAVVADSRDLRLQQSALVVLLPRGGDLVNLSGDPVHRGVGDDHHAGRVRRHSEVGQQLQRA